MKQFGGPLLFLNRSDINTDEIIPAKYLTEISKEALKPYCLEDLKLPDFNPKTDVPGKAAILTRANFGCGSSREHAPWALEVNGINVVVAESFARIFRQNMYNCGLLAIELPASTIEDLFKTFYGKPTTLKVDIEQGRLTFLSEGVSKEVSFTLSDFERALVKAGGWVQFAAERY
ncbi:3-isopropylmalate dehydratase small subunit [Treponema sp. J25]|uniref:3-isopropylmalate dehydratase small subunit n=1 Tax=Treponema sp. J25 TaxID=2094121 RepID=UPI0010485B1D|nr:3-isopropylmalate dehydratase small subunit [Treponema sp. J25]TCW62572.1 3-isopropylmalate dehydratase small subunit [Treponema sp. J25]